MIRMILNRRSLLTVFSAALAGLIAGKAATAAAPDPQNVLYLDTKDGRITILLRPDLAPQHVERIKALAKRGFYNGVVFHRVIEGFMAQTGDPTGTGRGGSELPNLPAEFTSTPFKRGTLGMARSSDPNSANSQFFICLADSAFLDGKYTVFGEVISGMDVVDKIKRGSKDDQGAVTAPDKIVKMQIAADVPAGKPK
jgi:peptidylprolyl isomerase